MRKVFLLCLLPTLLGMLFSLDKGARPFPTDLHYFSEGTTILLQWQDTPDLTGEVYHIYRYSSPIKTENLSKAELVDTVNAGVEEYRDRPSGTADWYYAVTAEDEKGHYPLAIPYINSGTLSVGLDRQAVVRENAVQITSLTARTMGSSILVDFDRNGSSRAISLYRSTSPIATPEQLRQSLLVAVLEGDQHAWQDKPIPGISYYYAALDREILNLEWESKILFKGNYTINPAVIPLSEFLDNPSLALPVRKAPLPLLQLEKYYNELPSLAISFPEKKALTPKLQRRVSAFLSDISQKEVKEILPRILSVDEEEESSALETKLKQILGEYFLKERWDHGQRALLLLLSEGKDPDLTARIHYYRGQCLYFSGNYEMSYLEFLLSRDIYYSESEEWMEILLNQFL